jgi:hypothetical protein
VRCFLIALPRPARTDARSMLLPRAEIPRAAMPSADIFYIVKRGST